MRLRLVDPLGLARVGAHALAGTLKLGGDALGEIAKLLELLSGSDAHDRSFAVASADVAPPATVESPTAYASLPPRGNHAGQAVMQLAPMHIDDEPVLVAESADVGAEDGAGAQIRVAQPWSGYTQLKAAEVIDRLVVESSGVLSLVLLYERSNRARRTVLSAAERELARRSSR